MLIEGSTRRKAHDDADGLGGKVGGPQGVAGARQECPPTLKYPFHGSSMPQDRTETKIR
jgi:hypothetical protein